MLNVVAMISGLTEAAATDSSYIHSLYCIDGDIYSAVVGTHKHLQMEGSCE